MLVSQYAVIRVFFTVLESFVLPTCNEQHSVQRSWRVPFFSFFLFFYFYVMSNTLYKNHGQFLFFFCSILYHHSQQPVSEQTMPWGQFLLSQRHSLYLRITCTRGQQHKEWWDFLWYGYCLLSLTPLYFDIYSSLTVTSKVNKTL